MKIDVYYAIMDIISQFGTRNSLKHASVTFPEVDPKTLGSLYAQYYQRRFKKIHFRHTYPDKMEQYYRKYCAKAKKDPSRTLIVRMAEEADIPPCFLAKIIVECYLMQTEYDMEPPPKAAVMQILKDTTRLNDPVMALQVDTCIIADEDYGPYVDTVKHTVGHEYEALLKQDLKEANIAFQDENDLRAKGYDKTPDTILDVPIAVDGFVVNWIESKASFGDEESHQGYLRDQYWSYWNRKLEQR
ncbi:hypothetical protein CAPTEDRAFT_214023 [Capitella teleta]|uniref:CDAN1-interacting nuclease 1 n=1 Tax=Capitella teleta TaxID=283909 RepID=R7TKM2_CAPTE|nr:hypothetical protein CAPTEDRAFT_214023 [Capitella teleta]|eukprot:ELT94052.1 hypothetical protein CAPTEDRAFT_214023 [Capitella teleta]